MYFHFIQLLNGNYPFFTQFISVKVIFMLQEITIKFEVQNHHLTKFRPLLYSVRHADLKIFLIISLYANQSFQQNDSLGQNAQIVHKARVFFIYWITLYYEIFQSAAIGKKIKIKIEIELKWDAVDDKL